MKIANEFNKLLLEIRNDFLFGDDSLSSLALKLFTPDELLQIGFFQNKIDEFSNRINLEENKDINEFFEKYIENIDITFMDYCIFEFCGRSIGDVIKNFKLFVIRNYFCKVLHGFIKDLKVSGGGFKN